MSKKTVERWTQQELLAWGEWKVLDGIQRGEKLSTTVFELFNTNCLWRQAQGPSC